MSETLYRLFEATGLVGGLWFLVSKIGLEVQSMRFRRQLMASAAANIAQKTAAAGGVERMRLPPISAAHEAKCIHCGKTAPMFIGGQPCTDEREAAPRRLP